jgi:hypothetical protein
MSWHFRRSMSPVRADATHAPVLEWDRIMVFGDLGGAVNECFISSHGTDLLPAGAPGTFGVPAGKEIQFYCGHGYSYVPDDITAQFRRMARSGVHGALNFQVGQNRNALRYSPLGGGGGGGAICNNYYLTKSQGRHGADIETADAAAGIAENYPSLQRACRQYGRVVVTIRNRRTSSGITLQDVINILRQKPETAGLNIFHCAFCRGGQSANYF